MTNTDGFLYTLCILFSLIGVVCLIFGVFKYTKKSDKTMSFLSKFITCRKEQKSPVFKRLDTMVIGYKKHIIAIEAGSQVLIIGAGEKELTLLANVDKNIFLNKSVPL